MRNGRCIFDYSHADGIVAIGDGEALFESKWSRAGGDSIHTYHDPASIEGIALATGANQISVMAEVMPHTPMDPGGAITTESFRISFS